MTASSDDACRPRTPVPQRGAKRSAANRRAAVARQRQARQRLWALAAVGLVVVVVAVFVIVKATGGSSHPSAAPGAGSGRTALPAALYAALTAAPVSDLAAAAHNYHSSSLTYPSVTNDPPITTHGKPEVLYMGAEYCPYCATERWALVVALSKFGTFHGLSMIHSDNQSTEQYRRVPTLSFYKSSYTSPYLTFDPLELATDTGAPLMKATKAELALIEKYNGGSYPFVYLSGKAIVGSAEYDPGLLVGRSWTQVVGSIAGGTSTLANQVDADAGAIVSDLCRMTGGRPAKVCSAFPKPVTSS